MLSKFKNAFCKKESKIQRFALSPRNVLSCFIGRERNIFSSLTSSTASPSRAIATKSKLTFGSVCMRTLTLSSQNSYLLT